ncbi:MAG: hypothetical protein OEX12_10140, partial [Gammaproteobacteria bacterium]|nr:hypothetical protein [Gammaproteobacteria bacterium]
MNTEQRRLILRLLTKLLLLGFIIGLIFVFMRSLPGSGLQKKQDRVDLGQLQTGQALLYDWNGKRVLILKRDMIGLSGLRQLDDELLDPYSHHSRQPTATKNFLRSLRAEYFIVLDYGTDLNCGLNYLPHSHTGP